jgi:hypothetical protein
MIFFMFCIFVNIECICNIVHIQEFDKWTCDDVNLIRHVIAAQRAFLKFSEQIYHLLPNLCLSGKLKSRTKRLAKEQGIGVPRCEELLMAVLSSGTRMDPMFVPAPTNLIMNLLGKSVEHTYYSTRIKHFCVQQMLPRDSPWHACDGP